MVSMAGCRLIVGRRTPELSRPADAFHHETIDDDRYCRSGDGCQFWTVNGDLPLDLCPDEPNLWYYS